MLYTTLLVNLKTLCNDVTLVNLLYILCSSSCRPTTVITQDSGPTSVTSVRSASPQAMLWSLICALTLARSLTSVQKSSVPSLSKLQEISKNMSALTQVKWRQCGFLLHGGKLSSLKFYLPSLLYLAFLRGLICIIFIITNILSRTFKRIWMRKEIKYFF